MTTKLFLIYSVKELDIQMKQHSVNSSSKIDVTRCNRFVIHFLSPYFVSVKYCMRYRKREANQEYNSILEVRHILKEISYQHQILPFPVETCLNMAVGKNKVRKFIDLPCKKTITMILCLMQSLFDLIRIIIRTPK